MNLEEIIKRRHAEMGGHPERAFSIWFHSVDWNWIGFIICLVIAWLFYSASVLLKVGIFDEVFK